MTFSIRNNELARIQSILADETYESETDMSKALIQGMVEELEKRDSFTYVYRTSDGFLELLWPFWYQKDAEKFHAEYGMTAVDPDTQYRIYRTESPDAHRKMVDSYAEKTLEVKEKLRKLNWPNLETTKAPDEPGPESGAGYVRRSRTPSAR